ncbi:MAG: AMP-binding protein, partial [Eggerthellaceae bacterium]|nr:AMP-binding protein [Eggerthellaceae bacterium]
MSMKYLQRIDENAASYPDCTAIETSTGASMTYGELWRASEAIAAFIRSSNIPEHEPVIVYGHKNPQMV